MSKTILADVDGFTPVIDSVVRDVGVMAAVVFGRMWRYCQMKDGICNASMETIAEELNLDRTTVMRHVEALEKAGYILDHSQGLRNRPHVYSDTGKAGLRVSISAKLPPTGGGNENQPGVANCDTTVANCDTASCCNLQHEDSIKRGVKKEVKREGAQENVRRSAVTPRGDWLDCILTHQKPSGKIDCSHFPEDLLPLAQSVCDLWHLSPPPNTKGARSNYAFWIKGLRSLQEACGEFGTQAIQAAYNTWLKSAFTVGHPGALAITCRAEAGKLRGMNRPTQPEDPYGGYSEEYVKDLREKLKQIRINQEARSHAP